MQAIKPRYDVVLADERLVSHAKVGLLAELADRVGLAAAVDRFVVRSRGRARRHEPAKVLRDLIVMLTDGGDCLSDLRLLAGCGPRGRRPARGRGRPGRPRPAGGSWTSTPRWSTPTPTASRARPAATNTPSDFTRWPATWTGATGAGRRWPASCPGNAGANDAADHLAVLELALAQLPTRPRRSRRVLVRSDSAGATGEFVWHLHRRRLRFSVGLPIDAHVRQAILSLPQAAWTPAIDADGRRRDGAWVAEATGWLDLTTWPPGTRAICRKERAHPGAKPRFVDADGNRYQVFATDQSDRDLARLELRHRRHARVEDRIRAAKATGLANLPFDRWRRNTIWLELVLCAQDLLCWTQALLLDGALALAEPKTLRYRLLHVAARIVHHARRTILRLQRSWPWAVELARAFAQLRALPLRC